MKYLLFILILLTLFSCQNNKQSEIKQYLDDSNIEIINNLEYLNMEEDEGTVNAHIARHKTFRKMFDAYPEGEVGKHAITHYKVIERYNYTTLVSCVLETGRTHQIRVHMKHIGHTLFNDQEYGGDRILKGTIYTKYKQFVQNSFKILPRHALHAKSLGFTHPRTGEWMFFDSELPSDMVETIEIDQCFCIISRFLISWVQCIKRNLTL